MSGYIGTQPVPQATQHRETFTATASQTTFATVGYTPQFVDVYLNGIHLLDTVDYTATNSSDVVLTTGAAASDVVEIISYTPFEVANQTFTGTTSVDVLTATGLVSASRSGVVADLNRTGSDGSIIDLRKDGTTVGSIGNAGTDVYFRKVSGAGVYCSGTAVLPFGAHSLGQASDRWSDLYLSGGVYLGGTAAANKLDDYEEGTWTPTCTVGLSVNSANYVKIGSQVTLTCYVGAITSNTNGSHAFIGGLPFVSTATESASAPLNHNSGAAGTPLIRVEQNSTLAYVINFNNTGVSFANLSSSILLFSVTYTTPS